MHSVFEKKKINYDYYKKESKKFERIDGDKKAWELDRSAKEQFGDASAEYMNILFFIKLRNKIEHRFMPAIDSAIVWECQALIINFERLLLSEFWEKYSLINNLYIPLQFGNQKRVMPVEKEAKKVLNFIKDFRDSIDPAISQQQEYAFKMFIIPKLGNHRNSSDVSVEYIKFDEENPEDMEKYEKLIVWIKEKQVWVANKWLYRPGKILQILEEKTWVKKKQSWHIVMWQKYKVRPKKGDPDKRRCDTKYCQYDEASTTKDYIYTNEWIEVLIWELNTEKNSE